MQQIKKLQEMKISHILLIAIATVGLGSCKAYHSLYDKYERPDVQTDGLVRDPVSDTDRLLQTDSANFGNLPWRQVFTDPILRQDIEKALANNPNLLNATLNIQIAEAQLKAAKLAFLPSVSFTPQGTISSFDFKKATQAYSLPLQVSWQADLFGSLTSAKRSAQMSLLQMKDYQLSTKTALISNVANLYYTLCMLDKNVEILDSMEVLAKQTWDKMAMMKESMIGYRSTSVESAEAAYYSIKTQKVDVQRQIREAENSLSLLMGEPAQAQKRNSLDSQSLPSQFSTGVGIQMLSNRPDVHAYEMALAQCFYGIENARSKFYPGINISGSGSFTNNNGLVNPGKVLLAAVGSLTQPIFQNGRLVAGLKVAKAQYEQAYNTWQNSILTAGSEVSNALVQYNSSEEKSKLEAHRIDVLRKNVDATTRLYSLSNPTYLEIITAQQNLLNAEINKVSYDFSKMQAVVSLYQALGGGVD